MGRYIIRRLLQAVPLLILITVIVFVLLKTVGDPLAYLAQDPRVTEADRIMLRARLGLNDPLPLQFVHWLIGDDWYMRDVTGDGVPDEYGQRLGILRGDFGESIRYRRPVTDVIGEFLPNTLLLGTTAYVVTIVVSLGIGIFAALRQYTLADNIITGVAFVTYSMPIFFIALLSVFIFSVSAKQAGLPYLPVQGMYDVRGDRSVWDLARHMILPAFSIAAINIAGYSRYVRSTMLEVISSDYILTARSKGLPERRVIYLHALKNAALPLITLIGLTMPFILSGAVVTETIFAWPGMGRLFITSLEYLDSPVLIIFVLMTAIAVVVFQLITDVLYAWLDPRVRYD
jgi:peptide/nickel transport system permease protein